MDFVTVAVGSEGSIKIRATKGALTALSLDGNVIGCKAESKVSIQPIGLPEIMMGARNRAKHAHELLPEAEFSVGIENGIIWEQGRAFDVPYVCVLRHLPGKTAEGVSLGTHFPIPPSMVYEVKRRKTEIGVIVQERAGGGEKDGMRFFSRGAVDRERILIQAIICAFAQVLNADLYED